MLQNIYIKKTYLERIHVIGLDRIQPHEVPGQAPGQTRQRRPALDRLSAVVNAYPLENKNVNNESGWISPVDTLR